MISQLRSLFLKNWIAKITCMLVAIGLWGWVSIQQTGQQKFEVPIEFINKPPNLLVSKKTTRNLTITLQGPKTSLYQTSRSDMAVRLDLTGQNPGTKVFWSSELSVDIPRGLQVINRSPQKIRIDLVERTNKKVNINTSVTSKPPDNFKYTYSVSPDTARVEGPRKVVSEFDGFKLTPIDLSNRDPGEHTISRQVKLPEGVKLKYPDKNNFSINVTITEKKAERTIKDVPVQVKNVPAGKQITRVDPENLDFTLKGPQSTIEELSADDIAVTVNAPQEPGLVIRGSELQLPEGVELSNRDDSVPAIKIRMEPR